MKIDVLSLFPEYFQGPLGVSILKRAQELGQIDIRLTDIRDFADNKHGKVDDRPYGGGPGMVLMAEPVCKAIRSVKREESYVIFLTPQGNPLTAHLCKELAKRPHLILLCGHYEGVDERAIEKEVDCEVSIGDFVLMSGCGPAALLIEGVARFVPGVLGHEEASTSDSFEKGWLEGPHYTRPEEFEGSKVPAVLLSGHHREIEKWREERGKEKTARVRPELL